MRVLPPLTLLLLTCACLALPTTPKPKNPTSKPPQNTPKPKTSTPKPNQPNKNATTTLTPDRIPSCYLHNGTKIQASEEHPIRTIEETGYIFACVDCYCVSDPELADSVDVFCVTYDCSVPRCVNHVRRQGGCCPVCPRGKNCYKPESALTVQVARKREKCEKKNTDLPEKERKKKCSKTRVRRILKAGKSRRVGDMSCQCDDSPIEFGQPYNKHALCVHIGRPRGY